MDSEPRNSLILPGAGARGAYQVGVLKFIAELVPAAAPSPFKILSGTSAGAINATVLACRAANFRAAVAEMEEVWSGFSTDQVFRADAWTMLKSSLHWLATLTLGGLGRRNPRSLLDCAPLRQLLERQIDFEAIEAALDAGHIDALAITASAYTSARSVTFFQTVDGPLPWARVRRIGRPETITLDHVMASAAVPFIFPPVRIGNEFYGDGSMRQRAPLSSSIHLGADRLLVIGGRDEHPDPEPGTAAAAAEPTFADVAGYMLDTLFMDGLYADLERLTRLNAIMEQVGPGQLQAPLARLRPIRTLIMLPSRDLREIAARHAREMPRPLRLLLSRLGAMRGGRTHNGGMQLISYLLFESGFTRELIDLGYNDAEARREELVAFMEEAPAETSE